MEPELNLSSDSPPAPVSSKSMGAAQLVREGTSVSRLLNEKTTSITLRQRLSRFVKKPLSFSKSRRMYRCHLKLFVCLYTQGHQHPLSATLKVPSGFLHSLKWGHVPAVRQHT